MTQRPPAAPILGELIRQQRELAELPMRQLAAMVGISNPYLSQIERGLRAPSEQVLEAIAKSLQTSADALYEQASTLAPAAEPASGVVAAIESDPDLTARQRQALIEVYGAMTEVTIARRRRPHRTPNTASAQETGKAQNAAKPGAGGRPRASRARN